MSGQKSPDAFDVATFAQRFDHHTPEYAAHLYEIYRHMRAECPVARSEAYGGFWILTRYEDVQRVATDDQTFSVQAGITIPSNRAPGDPPYLVPADYDPPLSRAYRRLMEPFVTPAALTRAEPMVRALVRELVNSFIEGGRADLVQDLAVPLTARATMRLAGLPEPDWTKFASESRSFHSVEEDPEEQARRLRERFAGTRRAVNDQIQAQRQRPIEGGLLAHLLNADFDGRPLADWEIEAMLINFIGGGLGTTQAFLGSAWVHLARRPDQRQALIDDRSLLGTAIEEMLRYFAPQPALSRVSLRDTEIGGVPIAKGDKVLMCWGAANRDGGKFENPEELDLRRKANPHMTFGLGAHYCMGANLTRLEARLCIEEVLNRLPDFQLVESEVVRIPDSSIVYGYLAVPATFTPGRKIPI